MVAVPLVNIGPITAADTSKLNVLESYSVRVVRGSRRNGQWADVTNAAGGSADVQEADRLHRHQDLRPARPATPTTPPPTSTTSRSPAAPATARMFVGQRKESFAVNLGTIFDLVNAPPAVVVGGNTPAGRALVPSTIADKNITSIALELPIAA